MREIRDMYVEERENERERPDQTGAREGSKTQGSG